jgi:DedD protein
MRYTSEAQATMDQQGLRDVDRWKDKIEVRLDNRQVAFLFFGSALVACMLFILGVIVGKRLESRGRAVAPEIEDPLALLDRVAATAPETPAASSPPPAQPRPAPERPVAAARPPASPPPPSEEAPPPAVTPPPPAVTPPPPAAARPVASPTAAAVPPAAAPPAGGKKPRFMLQIGSFPVRAEADTFAATFADERPVVIMSEIPGKGIWYRVRLGAFNAFKEAVDAKVAFEKRHNKIALVVGPL